MDEEEKEETQKPVRRSAKADQPAASDVVIDLWMRENIHGSAIARNTECYNVLVEAVRDLKTRIRAL